jgi:hypothetical protein
MEGDVLDRIASRVADVYKIEIDDISLKGKQQKRERTSSFSSHWAVRELRFSYRFRLTFADKFRRCWIFGGDRRNFRS